MTVVSPGKIRQDDKAYKKKKKKKVILNFLPQIQFKYIYMLLEDKKHFHLQK